MPYNKIEDLPERVRNHLPVHAQHIFLKSFNHAYEQYNHSDQRAFRVAWAAVKKKYHKADQKKGVDWESDEPGYHSKEEEENKNNPEGMDVEHSDDNKKHKHSKAIDNKGKKKRSRSESLTKSRKGKNHQQGGDDKENQDRGNKAKEQKDMRMISPKSQKSKKIMKEKKGIKGKNVNLRRRVSIP